MRLRRGPLVFALVIVMPLIGLDHTFAQDVAAASAVEVAPREIAGPKEAVKENVLEMEAPPLPMPTPLEMARKDKIYTGAYKDVYHILSGHNPCSSFFGGPLKAVEVLNGLFTRLETSRLADTKVGLTMSGQTSTVKSSRTGVSYRLFERAVINTGGPFYKRKSSIADPFVPSVGSFQPNTREARAAILLHEMGHLVQGPNGLWLLPNDGTDDALSRKNTETIEIRCGEQIKELGRSKEAVKLPTRKTTHEPQGSQ